MRSLSLLFLSPALLALSVWVLPLHAQPWVGSTDASGPIYHLGNVGVGLTTPAYALDVAGTAHFSGSLKVGEGTLWANPANGRVGINTTNPSYALTISPSASTPAIIKLGSPTSAIIGSGVLRIDPDGAGTAYWQFGRDDIRINGFSAGGAMNIAPLGDIPTLVLGTSPGQSKDFLQLRDTTLAVLSVFDELGRLGVGTHAPEHSLHVSGDATVDGDLYFTAGNAGNRLDSQGDGGVDWYVAGAKQVGIGGTAALAAHGRLGTAPVLMAQLGGGLGNLFEWRDAGGAALGTIDAAGKMGLGTASPAERLDVQGNVALSGLLLLQGADGAVLFPDGTAQSSAATASPWSTAGADVSYDGGNVGIGIGTPAHRLAVNGKIRAHEVIVDAANWPDYVFADDYPLRPLAEVARYIDAEGHLPDVASAKAVAAEGLTLGAMQAQLLRKVEELTLYLLQQEARIRELEARLQAAEQAPATPRTP